MRNYIFKIFVLSFKLILAIIFLLSTLNYNRKYLYLSLHPNGIILSPQHHISYHIFCILRLQRPPKQSTPHVPPRHQIHATQKAQTRQKTSPPQTQPQRPSRPTRSDGSSYLHALPPKGTMLSTRSSTRLAKRLGPRSSATKDSNER